MPIGPLALIVAGILVYFGVLQGLLVRLRIHDRAVLVWIAALLLGSLINVRAAAAPAPLTVNVGGALVPLALAGWLYHRVDTAGGRLRLVLAIAFTAGTVYGLNSIVPAPGATSLAEPLATNVMVAALVSYLLARSPEAAFAGAAVGLVTAQAASWVEPALSGAAQDVWLGGGRAYDAVVTAGILGVVVAAVFAPQGGAVTADHMVEERSPASPPDDGGLDTDTTTGRDQ